MCGQYITKDNKRICKQYQKQKHRGNRGFGIVNILDDMSFKVDRYTSEKDFTKRLGEIKRDNQNICTLVHHRYPTSTSNWSSQTHPISVKNDNLVHEYLVMHNGVISNDDKLKDLHDTEGYIYDTLIENFYRTRYGLFAGDSEWNDSNALAVEVAKWIEGKVPCISQVHGTYACIVLQIKDNKIHKIFTFRNSGNPLKKNNDVLGSELGKNDVDAGVLYELDISTFELTAVKDFVDNQKRTPVPNYNYGYSSGRVESNILNEHPLWGDEGYWSNNTIYDVDPEEDTADTGASVEMIQKNYDNFCNLWNEVEGWEDKSYQLEGYTLLDKYEKKDYCSTELWNELLALCEDYKWITRYNKLHSD